MRTLKPVLLIPLLVGVHTSIQAQTPPDAGSLRQQIEQQRSVPLPAARPERVATPPEIQPTAGMKVRVKAFRFAGNTLLSSEQLATPVASFSGRELDFAGLQRAADAVAAAYREAGWIVRAYLPEQDVSEGTITLQVVEARFGGVRFEGAPSLRVQRNGIESFFRQQQALGAPLNANALDRALLLADDLPGVSVAGTLTPGAQDGETALIVQTTDEPFIYGDVGLDNTGALSTGSERLTASLTVNSPRRRGDLLSLSALHTRGSDYARVAYTAPRGNNGLRLGVNATAMTYKVVNGSDSIKALGIQGRSSSMGMDWNYPLLRARLHNLYFTGGLENKRFFNDNLESKSDNAKSYSDYDSRSLRLGLSGNRFDDWLGGGANSASLQLQLGRLASMQAHTQIDSIDRSYHKMNYSLSRQQAITGAHSVILSLQGQQASQVLDSSEKFYIGGAGSVRAYPASELGGERGQVITAEWRWRLDSAWLITAFADAGRIAALPATASAHQPTLHLNGRGISLGWEGPAGLSTRLTWAHRNSVNPKPTQTGTDSDGTLTRNRIWFTASIPF